jgi:hypothetical protein
MQTHTVSIAQGTQNNKVPKKSSLVATQNYSVAKQFGNFLEASQNISVAKH